MVGEIDGLCGVWGMNTREGLTGRKNVLLIDSRRVILI